MNDIFRQYLYWIVTNKWRIDKKMKIGIDLGGSHIAIGVVDDKDYIVEKVEKRLLSKDKKI